MSGFTFTSSELTQLENLASPALAQNDNTGAGAAIYQAILDDITTTITSGGMLGGDPAVTTTLEPSTGVDPAVWDWLNGAITVNEDSSFFGQFIVTYTLDGLAIRAPQSDLSAGGLAPNELVAEASNQIALNVADQIIASGLTTGIYTLQSLGVIENVDAGAAATTVFDAVYGGDGTPSDDLPGWAGILLFPFLGDPDNDFNTYLLNTLTINNPTNGFNKHVPGLYDLVAALEASNQAFLATGLNNPATFVEDALNPIYDNLLVPGNRILGLIETDINNTNTIFTKYYNLIDAQVTFDVGNDLLFNEAFGIPAIGYQPQNNVYIAGYATLADDITTTSTLTTNAIIVGGTGNNTIVAPVSGDDLIDGGVGGMNTLDLSYVDGPLTIQMGTDTIESQLTITGSDISTDGAGDAIPGSRTIYAYDFNEITLDSTAASTFVTEGGETIGLNLTLASSTQNPILQFSSGTGQSFNASTLNEVLVVSGMSDILTAGSSNVTLIDLNGGTVDFSGGNYANLTEIGPQGSSTSGFSITPGSETFNFGSGTNVLVGGTGDNTFVMAPSLTSGVNIIWGGGGTSTYDIYGDVDILYTDGTPTPQQIESLTSDISGLEAAALTSAENAKDPTAALSGGGMVTFSSIPTFSGPVTFLINPSSNDNVNGISGNYNIAELSTGHTNPIGFERSLSSDGAGSFGPVFNAAVATFAPIDGIVTFEGMPLTQEASDQFFEGAIDVPLPTPNDTPTIEFDNFVNGDLNITLGGTLSGQIASDSSFITNSPIGPFLYNQSSVLDLGNGSASSSTGGSTTNGENLIPSGGVSFDEVVSSAGTQYILNGGSAMATSVGAGGNEVVLNGGVESAAQFYDGGIGVVSSGGTTYIPTISSGSTQYISGGGAAYAPMISGGTQIVEAGGLTESAAVQANGTQILLSGASAYNGIVGAGGTEMVSGGDLYDATVQSGGVVLLYSGGVTPGTVLEAGGTEIVESGVAVQAPIVNAGTEIVEGQAASVTVNAPGTLIIAGGTVDSANVNYLAEIIVSGGLAQNVNGWTEVVESGGIISGSTDDSFELLSSGGTDVGTTITAYAAQDNYGGTSFNDIVADLGVVNIGYGGIAYSTVVDQGGAQFILSAATVFYTSVSGYQAVAGGTAISSLITDGGQESLYSDGQMFDTTLVSGASVELFNSGTAVDTVLIGATALDNYQGYLIDTAVSSGGTNIVFAGGTASGSMVYAGGNEVVSDYSQAIATTVYQGGVQSVGSAGYAFGTLVQAGGSEVAVDGQISSSLIYGTAIISSGGFAGSSLITDGGVETVSTGGTALYADVSSGGTLVLAGGSVGYGTVNSDGLAFVASGGEAYGMLIGPQGTENVSAGGTDNNAIVNGGTLVVGPEAMATDDVISSGGLEFVSGAGAYSLSTTILRGGTEIVLAGGTATDTSDGGVLILEGGGTADVAFGGGLAHPALAASQATVPAAGASYSTQARPAFMGTSVQTGGSYASAAVVFLQMSTDSVATVTGANAVPTAFNIVSDMAAGGASYTINDFIGSGSAIYLVNSTGTGPGDAIVSSMTNVGGNALITLSDGTNITLTGLTTSALRIETGSNGITSIT